MVAPGTDGVQTIESGERMATYSVGVALQRIQDGLFTDIIHLERLFRR
jgi:hypothetical protein